MIARTRRLIWLIVGGLALALGAIGIVLPLLPTTPFLLVAAFAFAESSERMHQWLLNHNVFGALIHDWQRHRAISRSAKVASVAAMAAVFLITAFHQVPTTVLVVQALVLVPCALFVVTRPLPPADNADAGRKSAP